MNSAAAANPVMNIMHAACVEKKCQECFNLSCGFCLKPTLRAVPFVMSGGGFKFRPLTHEPGLSDVAPTVLELMGLKVPAEMSGQSLLLR